MNEFIYHLTKYLWNNNPYTLIKNWINGKIFLNKPPIRVDIKKGVYDIDIYIIAFNRPELIEPQIYFLKKNLIDKYRLIIADNSNIEKKSLEIENICKENNISYIKLPKNKLKNSYSHGISLNYLMKHFIIRESTKYFGLLDHDCYLIKQVSILKILGKQPFFGLIKDKFEIKILNHKYNFFGKRRFLWPGCSFFKKNLFNKGYNFLPVKTYCPISFLDTGGGNYQYIYKNYKKDNLSFLREEWRKDDCGEYIGDLFFHIGGASYRNSYKGSINILFKKYNNNEKK